jgi:hypothetical protein
MSEISTASARNRLFGRAKLTNSPLRVRAHGWTAHGRRLRDLYLDYWAKIGNPTDPATQALCLAASELVVAAEAARARLLAGEGDAALLDQVIRLENLSARAVRRLGIKPVTAASPGRQSKLEALRARLAIENAEAAKQACRDDTGATPVRQNGSRESEPGSAAGRTHGDRRAS